MCLPRTAVLQFISIIPFSRCYAPPQNIGIGIFDTGVWRGATGQRLGALHWYAGIRRNNNEFEYGWETLYSTWNNWYPASGASVFVRVERDAVAGTWTAFFKFNAGDDWVRNPRTGYDALLINGTLTQPLTSTVKIGLLARTWSGTYRCMGYFKYIRVTPLLACSALGSPRTVFANSPACTGGTCVTQMTGFTPGRTVAVQVASSNGVTTSAPLLAGAPFTAPQPPANQVDYSNVAASVAARQLVEVAVGKQAFEPTVWANNANWGPSVMFDSNLNTYAQAGNPLQPNGDWWAVDLGRPMAVKSIYIVNRQNCCQLRSQYLEWYVGNAPPPAWQENTLCPQAAYPNLQLSTPGPFSPAFNASLPYSGFFGCALTGRYVFLHAPQSLGVLNAADGQFNLAEVRVYASNSCPARGGVNVLTTTPTTCAGGINGDVCVETCAPGTASVSGVGVSYCNGDEWDQDPLVCSPVCPPVNPPPLSDTCTNTLFSESFPLGDEAGAMARWSTFGGPGQYFGTSWFVNDGMLSASTTLGCSDMLHAVYYSDKVVAYRGDFTLTAAVSTVDRAGLVWRAQDAGNLYRFYLDTTLPAGLHVLERVQNFVTTRLTDGVRLGVLPGSWHTVSVSVVGTQFNISLDGTPLLSVVDGTFASGYAGVFAGTKAQFDSVVYNVPCSGGCSGALAGETCAFTCHPGLIAAGPTSRTCMPSGVWSPDLLAAPLSCVVGPPTLLASTISVPENADRNALVGMPLLGSSGAPDYQLLYEIDAETPLDPAIGSLFYIDACSGQVLTRQGGFGVIDYERQSNYTLLVRAYITGFPSAQAFANISVAILNVDEPPILTDTILNVTENSPFNGTVGTIRWRDPEGSVVMWSIASVAGGPSAAVTGGAPLFGITNATGRVFTALSPPANIAALDFETYGGAAIVVTVTASQVNNPALSGSGRLFVWLQDANDAPVITPSQVIRVPEAAARTGATAGAVNATDQDGPSSRFFSPTTFSLVPLAAYNRTPACTGTAMMPGTTLPTVDGTLASSALFQLLPGSGTLAWTVLTPLPNYASAPATAVNSVLVRGAYSVCLNATDAFGATAWASSPCSSSRTRPRAPWRPPSAARPSCPRWAGRRSSSRARSRPRPGMCTPRTTARPPRGRPSTPRCRPAPSTARRPPCPAPPCPAPARASCGRCTWTACPWACPCRSRRPTARPWSRPSRATRTRPRTAAGSAWGRSSRSPRARARSAPLARSSP